MAGKSLLCLLQRCVAVRQVTLPTGIKTRGGVLSGRCGFIQQRTWTSTARTACLQGLGRPQSAGRTFCNKTGAPWEDEYPPLPAYQPELEQGKKAVYIVRVKGLPWSCTAQDLLQFFSDCRIHNGVKGIHLTVDKQGRPSGKAFIEMEHEEDVSKALEKHRQYLGTRYVEVYEMTNHDAEDILKKAVRTPPKGGVVRLRGLPFTCTKADIHQFFSGLDILENGITMTTDATGRNTGEAFVHFSSQEEADEALQRHREVIGHRYIEVFPSRQDEIYSGKARSSAPQWANRAASRTRSPQSFAPSLHCIHMRGIPFEGSGEDIVRFFSPLVVCKILLECGPDGRPSGEADVFFSCHQDAMVAMSRDRECIGGRYIELFLNTLPDSD